MCVAELQKLVCFKGRQNSHEGVPVVQCTGSTHCSKVMMVFKVPFSVSSFAPENIWNLDLAYASPLAALQAPRER